MGQLKRVIHFNHRIYKTWETFYLHDVSLWLNNKNKAVYLTIQCNYLRVFSDLKACFCSVWMRWFGKKLQRTTLLWLIYVDHGVRPDFCRGGEGVSIQPQWNSQKGFGWYLGYSVTNSWSDIIRTLFENSPVYKYVYIGFWKKKIHLHFQMILEIVQKKTWN